MTTVSTIIPTFGGADLLRSYLPGVTAVLADCGEVIVVDDASTDHTREMIAHRFPHVRVIARKTNGGFSAAVNDGIRATSGEFIVLLNNDVEVTPGFLDSILPLFDDSNVFAVSPEILLPKRNNLDEGAKTGFWHHGLFYPDQRQGLTVVTPVLYTTGCAAVYRASMLKELGGFDEFYSPFYWEDADLGYRAWKRGWKSLYQPASTVYHQHSATISRVRAGFTDRIKARNSLYFVWRNIEDPAMLAMHRRWLPLVLAKRAAKWDWPFVTGWREAFTLGEQAVRARAQDSVHRVLSDREIFSICGIEVRD